MNSTPPNRPRLNPLYFLALTLLIALPGCATGNHEPLIVETRPDTPPQLGTAPEDGQYALYTANSTQPLAIYSLKMGERLGFESLEGGSVGGFSVNYLAAVAGPNVLRLDSAQSYQWRRHG